MGTLVGGDYYELARNSMVPAELVADPPRYSICVAQLEAAAAAAPRKLYTLTGVQLLSKCRQLYQALRSQAAAFVGVAGDDKPAPGSPAILSAPEIERLVHHYVGDEDAEALVRANELGMRPLAAHCHAGLAKLARRVGEPQDADEHFATASAMYRDMGMTSWLKKLEGELRPE